MIQISYISRASKPMSAESLLELLQWCLKANTSLGVTGMLLYGNQTFLQTLEGEESVVDDLVEKIRQDPRHTDLQVLSRRPIEHRQYADWSMGFERITDHGLQHIDGLKDFAEKDFTVDNLANNDAIVETLMDHFRAPSWDPLVRELDAKDKVIEHLKKSLTRSRGSVAVANLVLESVIEAGKRGALSDAHLRLCESTLNSLRPT